MSASHIIPVYRDETPARMCAGCPAILPPPGNRRGRERKWCSDRCRKQTTYAKDCIDCGKQLNGSDGHASESRRCVECARAWGVKHTRQWILDSFAEWAERFGEQPSAMDWNRALCAAHGAAWRLDRIDKSGRPWPSVTLVQDHFGSWNAGVAAAGFEPRSREGVWTRDRILAAVKAWHAQHGRLPTSREWHYAHAEWPCSSTVMYRFGTWNKAMRAAGFEPRPVRSDGTLTDAEVVAIRTSPEQGIDLAEQYGIHPTYVSQIRCGRVRRDAVAA